MDARNCRLFDDTVVRNIMVSTGIAVLDYIRRRKTANEDEICDFVESNAEMIIADTLEEMEGQESDEPEDNAWKDGEGPGLPPPAGTE
jgi:hypothetical protein